MRRNANREERGGRLLSALAAAVLLTLLLGIIHRLYHCEYTDTDTPNDCFAVSAATGETALPKMVCLTFDDGPSKNTVPILEILDREQVPATFFVCAQDANERYLPLVADIAAAGHQIALHSATHQYSKIYASTDAFWQDIKALRSHGIDLKEVEKAIRQTTGISEKKLNELIDDVVERNQKYYTEVIDLARVTQPDVLVDATTIDAIKRQTQDVFRNITASMGFLVDAGRTMLPPAKAYQWALDSATLKVESGAISYGQSIKDAVRELASGGLRVVDYESGHRDHVDVAARRAVMTGVSQLCSKYTEQAAEYMETPYYEVSAHAGARDVPGRSPWASHKEWQGKVYSTRSGDIYPNIYEVCGLGAVDGLEGVNCRHRRNVWVEGVSERTYTDEQLAHIDDGLGCTFDGKTYTAYEATQEQRKVERTIRKLKREKTAYNAAGLTDEEQAVNIKLRRLNAKYKAFSKAAGLPEQRERMKVLY